MVASSVDMVKEKMGDLFKEKILFSKLASDIPFNPDSKKFRPKKINPKLIIIFPKVFKIFFLKQ